MTNTTTAMSRMTMSLSKSAAIASAEMAAKMAKQMDVVGVAGLLWTTPLAERETRMSFQPFDDVSEATSLTLQQCSGDLLRIDQLPGIEVTEADIVPEDPVEAFEEKIQELEEERKEAAVMMVVDLRHGPVVAAIDEELMTLRTELEELKEKVDAERREKMGLTSTLTNATVNIVGTYKPAILRCFSTTNLEMKFLQRIAMYLWEFIGNSKMKISVGHFGTLKRLAEL
jgi:hypothetical protein